MASRVSIRRHAGFTIYTLNFAALQRGQDALDLVERAIAALQMEAPGQPVRLLLDLTNAPTTPLVLAALVELILLQGHVVDRTAVICAAMRERVAYRQIRRLALADINEFRTRGDALAYLRDGTPRHVDAPPEKS